jgi:hypothetical protein
MAFDSIPNSALDTDSPLSNAALMGPLKNRDDWNASAATGSGVGPSIGAVTAGLASGHSHNGDPGEGNPIDTPGIADGAASVGEMYAANAVSAAKVASTTMQSANVASGAAPVGKWSGSLGRAVTGSKAYDTEEAPGTGDLDFLGDTLVIGNPKGALGVIVNMKAGASDSGEIEYFIKGITGAEITFGFRDSVLGGVPGAGTWYVDCEII